MQRDAGNGYPEDRLARRESFRGVAELYTSARPAYPDELVADLVRLCDVGPESRVLEIGPGTGQLTIPLAETGGTVLAVELGAELATIARQRLLPYDRVRVVVADYDSWSIPAGKFDVVVAATSFHWLDPVTRLQRFHLALKPGGKLAIVETRWGVRTGTEDTFSRRSQRCYSRWDPDHDPKYWAPSPEEVPVGAPRIDESDRFRKAERRRYLVQRAYTRTQLLQLITTYSTIQSWSADRREGFLLCMGQLIDEEFGGSVERCDLYDLTVATAA